MGYQRRVHGDTRCHNTPNIMKTFIALAVVALALSANAKPDFESCSGFDNTPFVNPFHLNVLPDPLVIKKGAQVKIHFDATLVAELPAGAKIDVQLVKEGVPIPCLPIPGVPVKIGSCSYDAQTLLDFVPADLCSQFAPEGEDCKLPLMAGKYGDQDPNGAAVIDITDDIPALIKTIINGDIKIEAKASDASGTEILCIENTVSISTNYAIAAAGTNASIME